MKKSFALLLPLLFVLGALALMGCREDLEDPSTQRETGFIIAGESSTALSTIDFTNHPLTVSTGSSNGNSHDFALNTAGDLHLQLGGSAYWGTGYHGSSEVASGSVEFAGHYFQDSIFVCYDVSPDSTEGDIYHYSASFGTSCQNGSQLESVRELPFGDALLENTRIDASLSWLSESVFLDFVGVRFTVGGPTGNLIDHYNTGHNEWDTRGINYLGFRVWESGIWHYGYVKLQTRAGEVLIHKIVYEHL